MIPLDTQTNIIVQNLGEWLTPMMNFFSLLGVQTYQLLIIAAIYWCFDRDLGARLGLLLLFASSLNSLLKIAFHSPRPYWVDEKVRALASEPSFGFPSGHSQEAVVFWGLLGANKRRLSSILAAIFLIIMIGVSRIFLGVHFLTDVLGGWLIGAFLLSGFLFFEHPFSHWLAKRSPFGRLLTGLVPAGVLMAGGIIAIHSLQGWDIPQEWLSLSSRSGTIHPIRLQSVFSSSGLFIGFIIGLYYLSQFENRYGTFTIKGTNAQKFWRLATGLAGWLFIYSGLGLIFPHEDSLIGLFFRFTRYGLTGFWISGLAPLFFLKTGLISRDAAFRVKSSGTQD